MSPSWGNEDSEAGPSMVTKSELSYRSARDQEESGYAVPGSFSSYIQ